MKHSDQSQGEVVSQYRTLLETSTDGFFINVGGLICYANAALQRLLGAKSETELVGRPVFDIIDSRWHEVVRERIRATCASTGPIKPLEEQYVRLDGSRVDVEVTAVAIIQEGERASLVTVRDISERKEAERERLRLEEQLRQSQKMEALGTLAGGVAHDFNNILACVTGNADLASMRLSTAHPAQYHIDEILVAVARAKGLTAQVLAFSKGQPRSLHALDLRKVVTEELSLLRAAQPPGISLREQISEESHPVLADATQIHQVLLNLCTNAWQALQGRTGSVTVGLSKGTFLDSGTTTLGDPQMYAILSVHDDGPGIDASIRSRIFDPFFTTKAPGTGTGLGLSVVHGIARTHDARLICDSEPHQGTTFRLFFPLIPELSTPVPERKLAIARGSGQAILFLDDEPSLVEIATRVLDAQGYRVEGKTQPEEALAALRANPRGFDLLISDAKMPGYTGLDVARAARALNPDLPIILVSGFLSDDIVSQGTDAGVRLMINKPINSEELCSAVAAVLHG